MTLGYFTKTRSVFYPLSNRFNPSGRGLLELGDYLLDRELIAHKRAAAREILFALQILGHIQIGEAGEFARNILRLGL